MAFQDTFGQLEYLGLFDVLLPFILIFTIVFAIMQKAKIFGDNAKNYNIMIALVMGLAVVFPHVLGYYPPEKDVVLIINHALPNVGIVLVAIIMALLLLGILGGRMELGGGSLSGWIAMASFGIIVFIFGAAAEWWGLPDFLSVLNDPDTMALVITILVFAIVIWFITKEDKTFADDDKGKAAREAYEKGRFMSQLGDMVKWNK
jgi:hypothetical protein